jgi:hypothetical protein
MPANPYAPPGADIEVLPVPREVPPEIAKMIKEAAMAGAISGSFTLIFTLVSIFISPMLNMSVWSLVDVALAFGLAFGIHRKSRVCATLLFVYFIGAKIYILSIAPTFGAGGLVMGAVFAYYFFRGILGTFRYHKWIASSPVEA